MIYNVFEGNTNTYILTVIDVTSRYKIVRALSPEKASEIVFVLEAICKKGGVFIYPKFISM